MIGVLRVAARWSFILMTLFPVLGARNAAAGPRGSEFDLTLTPAAGGMEGVGLVRPQDPVAMLFGNPATITKIESTFSFTLGAAYVSPDLHARHDGTNPFAGPEWEGRSRLTDVAAPSATALHRLSDELVWGFGFTAISGLGSDFRNVSGSPNLVAELKLFGANLGLGYTVNERFSIGAVATIGIGSLQVGAISNTASVNDFGLGGTVGFTYGGDKVSIGGTYKAPMSITYRSVVETGPDSFGDFELEQPQELAFGIATGEGLSKNTFLELDVRWKNWDDAEGYNGFWKDQMVYSIGAQHNFGALTLRAGYSYGDKLAKDSADLGTNIGSITQVFFPEFGFALPVTPEFIQLFQATLTDGYWRQSVSFGLGIALSDAVTLDFNMSFAYDGEIQIGAFDVDGSIYNGGMGFTWKMK